MASRPAIRDQLYDELRKRGRVSGESIPDLKREVNMENVSNTQFHRALNSLCYGSGRVGMRRSRTRDMTPKAYDVWPVIV